MEIKNNSVLLILFILPAFILSCNSDRIYSKMQDLNNAS